MNKPDIVIVVEDPGAANFIQYFPEIFSNLNINTIIFSLNLASKFLKERNIDCIPVNDFDLLDRVVKLHPDVLIIGTSDNRDSQVLALIDVADNHSIPTLGVIDSIMSYQFRFSGRTDNALEYAPDWLFVPNEETHRCYAKLGFPEDKIFMVGHPRYMDVVKKKADFDSRGCAFYRNKLLPKKCSNRFVIFFVAEPEVPIENQSNIVGQFDLFNSDERCYVALNSLVRACQNKFPDAFIILRLHPKNRPSEFEEFKSSIGIISSEKDPLPLVYASDLVVGMTSSLMVESLILNKPVISIISRENDRNELPVWTNSLIFQAMNQAELENLLNREIHTFSSNRVSKLDHIVNSTSMISTAIKEILYSYGVGIENE